MISNAVVIGSVLFGIAFLLAWFSSPELRRRVEQPKYRFLSRLEQHERAHGGPEEGRAVR